MEEEKTILEEDKKVAAEERKTPVKRVVQCGSCLKWYRKTRMYRVHFEVSKVNVDEDRLVCPKCYASMGYSSAYIDDDYSETQPTDDVEFISDPYHVKDIGTTQMSLPTQLDYPVVQIAEE